MPNPAPSNDELAKLRRQLVAKATRHLGHADGEEVTQEALLRLLGDRKPTELPLRPRAFRKLRDASAELLRNPKRRFEAECTPVSGTDHLPTQSPQEAALDLIAMRQQIIQIAGPDVWEYAQAKKEGRTAREMVDTLGWTPQRVEAAGRQLRRKSAAILRMIQESAPE
jgi:DNA-directed RNA polymerase specialized sigma24 family protein